MDVIRRPGDVDVVGHRSAVAVEVDLDDVRWPGPSTNKRISRLLPSGRMNAVSNTILRSSPDPAKGAAADPDGIRTAKLLQPQPQNAWNSPIASWARSRSGAG